MNQSFQLAEYIKYQEGSVVSKEIISKAAGTVTLFAFDKEQGLSEHTTPYGALVYILDGKADITLSAKKYILEKGESIIFPPNQPHVLKARERFKMLLVMIKS